MTLRLPAALDLNWITPALAIGGRYAPKSAVVLAREHRIRWVVDLRAEDSDDPRLLARHGIQLLYLPTPDTEPATAEMLSRGVAWARQAMDSGGRVLVHCEYGIGRSALLACCILVSQGHTPLEALLKAKTARQKVSPSPSQLEALLGWTRDWHAACRTSCPVVTWDELAAVAYTQLSDSG